MFTVVLFLRFMSLECTNTVNAYVTPNDSTPDGSVSTLKVDGKEGTSSPQKDP